MRRHRFHPEARTEARATVTWYRERSRDAARAFTSALAEGLQSIREHPEAWPVWPRRVEVRRRVLGQLPFSIFYIVDEDIVVIVAIAHHRQRPGYWLARIR